jgi:hypothetical protein
LPAAKCGGLRRRRDGEAEGDGHFAAGGGLDGWIGGEQPGHTVNDELIGSDPCAAGRRLRAVRGNVASAEALPRALTIGIEALQFGFEPRGRAVVLPFGI